MSNKTSYFDSQIELFISKLIWKYQPSRLFFKNKFVI